MHQTPTTDPATAYAEGVEAGRHAAAAAIRAKAAGYAGEQYRHFQMCARIADGQSVPVTRMDLQAAVDAGQAGPLVAAPDVDGDPDTMTAEQLARALLTDDEDVTR